MGPKGKSKSLALKHSYLGQYNKNAKTLSEMEIRIQKQGESMKFKQKKLDYLVEKERRKLNHRKEKLKRIMESIESYDRTCRKRANETAFSISKKKKSNRKHKPTNNETPHMAKIVRCSETIQACAAIPGFSV